MLLIRRSEVGSVVRLTRTITMSISYTAEKQVAISAVRRACILTDSVFNKLVKNETLTKDDKSPVTGELWSRLILLFVYCY